MCWTRSLSAGLEHCPPASLGDHCHVVHSFKLPKLWSLHLKIICIMAAWSHAGDWFHIWCQYSYTESSVHKVILHNSVLGFSTHAWAHIKYLSACENLLPLVTGGADRLIKLWEVDTKLCLQEYVGHSDVVRDVKVTSSETFLSASNDWWVYGGGIIRISTHYHYMEGNQCLLDACVEGIVDNK